MPSASTPRTRSWYRPSSNTGQVAKGALKLPWRSTWVNRGSCAISTCHIVAAPRAGRGRFSKAASCRASGTPERSGSGSSARGRPTSPRALTATPWPGLSNAAAEPLSVSRACTATDPSSTAVVVAPSGVRRTSKRVPRTLVDAEGVRISRWRGVVSWFGTEVSTLPRCISSTD